MANTNKGYYNGSDLLLSVVGKCVGHCATHQVSFKAETKEHNVKPPKTAAKGSGLWAEKSVSKLGITITFEGLRHYEEMEGSVADLKTAWYNHEPVEVKSFERGSETPDLVGKFILTDLTETAPANDDVSYSGTLENVGEPDTFTQAESSGT